jgi:hypothetical protein
MLLKTTSFLCFHRVQQARCTKVLEWGELALGRMVQIVVARRWSTSTPIIHHSCLAIGQERTKCVAVSGLESHMGHVSSSSMFFFFRLDLHLMRSYTNSQQKCCTFGGVRLHQTNAEKAALSPLFLIALYTFEVCIFVSSGLSVRSGQRLVKWVRQHHFH